MLIGTEPINSVAAHSACVYVQLQIHGYELRINTTIDEKDALTAVLLDAPLQSSSFFLPSNLTMRFHRFSYVYGGFTNESVATYWPIHLKVGIITDFRYYCIY